MLDYSNKEFVRSFSVSTFKDFRKMSCKEVICGREYVKFGTACATTAVCDCWKVYDSSVERFKYVYLVGVARQHPNDICVKYSDGVEIAHEHAMTNPVMTLVYDTPVSYEFIEDMMRNYISALPKQMVRTPEECREIELDNFFSNLDFGDEIYCDYEEVDE